MCFLVFLQLLLATEDYEFDQALANEAIRSKELLQEARSYVGNFDSKTIAREAKRTQEKLGGLNAGVLIRQSHIHPPPTDVRTHTQHAHPQHGFVILQLLNVGYLQMTLSWLCNLQMVADAGTSNAMNVRLYLTFVARQDKTT